MQNSFRIIVAIITVLFSSCSKDSSHNSYKAFYYWKSVFSVSVEQKTLLDDLKVKKIYIKFFDVKLNDSLKPIPIATINFKDSVPGIEIIPVVYITNKTFSEIDS